MLEALRLQAERISARTGLKKDTCLDLILSGWSFNQETGQPDRWSSPSASLGLPKK